VLRRLGLPLFLAVCLSMVVAFQVTRPDKAVSNPAPFVPSPQVYKYLPGGVRPAVADAYWLDIVQYYGEHAMTDGRLDSLPKMLNLVTDLSPHFVRAYLFGAPALLFDTGDGQAAFDLLLKGRKANPREWRIPALLGLFTYQYARNKDKALIAARLYREASELPGAPPYVSRLAARLTQKGGKREKAILLWGQAYAEGDTYSRQKALAALAGLLPEDSAGRQAILTDLSKNMPPEQFRQLVQDLAARLKAQ
jgi:hypothetical protein